MYFKDFLNHPEARINPSLFWEYNIDKIDFMAMRNVVVHRVVERGWPDDWYGMLNLYGVEEVKNVIKHLPYLNNKDLNFLSSEFGIPLIDFICYSKEPLARQHWNS